MTDPLEGVGALHVTFEYPNRVASQKVMKTIMEKVRFVGDTLNYQKGELTLPIGAMLSALMFRPSA